MRQQVLVRCFASLTSETRADRLRRFYHGTALRLKRSGGTMQNRTSAASITTPPLEALGARPGLQRHSPVPTSPVPPALLTTSPSPSPPAPPHPPRSPPTPPRSPPPPLRPPDLPLAPWPPGRPPHALVSGAAIAGGAIVAACLILCAWGVARLRRRPGGLRRLFRRRRNSFGPLSDPLNSLGTLTPVAPPPAPLSLSGDGDGE